MAYFIFLKSFKPRSSLPKFLCSKIHSSSHSCLPKFSKIFWEFFGIFPNYFCHSNFLIHFPKSRNQFWMDFLFSFLFFSNPAGPPTSLALASWPTQDAQPTSPLSGPPAPSGRVAKQSPTAPPEPPWPPPPLVQDPFLPPLNRSR
jgi:hypothetical protein